MYSTDTIAGLVNEKIASTDFFVVDITISKDNRIAVFIDGEEGVGIDICVAISRYIDENLDRETEDYELEVSSAGIGYPFKVARQYIKNMGQPVEVILKDGRKIKGVLHKFENDEMTLEMDKKIKPEGKKRKELVKVLEVFTLEQIKTTKLLLDI